MSAVAECYAYVTTPFGVKGPYYDPNIGHRGTDYRRGARQTVVAYESGEIGYVGQTTGLGRVLGMKLDKGGYAGWAHLYDIRVKVGQRVSAGTVLALVAGSGDSPGTLWSGSHIHTTLHSASSYAAATGVYPGLSDPAPRIAAAVKASLPAGGGSIPIPTPAPEEDNEMQGYRLFQNPRAFYVRSSWQSFPWQVMPRQENFAAGTGGPGLYNINLHMDLSDFWAEGQVEGKFVRKLSDGSFSDSYEFTVNGHARGEVDADFSADIPIPAGTELFLQLRKSFGDRDPLLRKFTVSVKNFKI